MIARRRFKVLAMDADPPFAKHLPMMLDTLGCDCEMALSQEKAQERLRAEHFDVLIAEYHMPCGNAFHFICCLRRAGLMLPAIVMSHDERILELTPDILNIPAVLVKPFGLSQLGTALVAALLR
jgi:DNA-binding response OmpR family regulator